MIGSQKFATVIAFFGAMQIFVIRKDNNNRHHLKKILLQYFMGQTYHSVFSFLLSKKLMKLEKVTNFPTSRLKVFAWDSI